MNIMIISDLHLEFGTLIIPKTENEANSVLIIAGDLGLASKSYTYIPFLSEASERFQDVIYVLGNHEFYGSSIHRAHDKIKQAIVDQGGMENVHVLNNDILRIKNISFIGSTMWASYNKNDPCCMNDAQLWMNDHKKIRIETRKY